MDGRIARWCRIHLGAEPVAELFRAGYLSSVVGLRLDDGRDVVVKARAASPRLDACVDVQRVLADAGFPCPAPIGGVTLLDGNAVEAEAYVPGGDAMPAGGRHADPFATAFAALTASAPAPEETTTLDPSPPWTAWNHDGLGLWPRPDDLDGDLNALDAPAWIDRAGRAAQGRLRAHALDRPRVIGHCDWYAGNLRWTGDTLFVAHDWDSVFADTEAAVVGFAAAVYPAVHAGSEAAVDETEQFIERYVERSGRTFTTDDLECAWAAGVWLRAFDARKQHAKGQAIASLNEAEADERLRRAGAR